MKKLVMAILPMVFLVACKTTDGGAGVTQTPDGMRFDLSSSPKGWVTADTNFGKLTGYNQDDSFYGAWVDDSRQFRQIYYQGTEATNIPQSGQATYVGNVVRIENGVANNVGKSRLDVSFGDKTVKGQLSLDGFRRDVTLHKTNLNGAKFEGKASVLLNNGGTYKGALMGRGASEVAGLVEFKNDSNLDSAFGGKRYND